MILSFKKFDNLLLYLSLKVGVIFMNSQHLRLKWHFEKLDKYGPWATSSTPNNIITDFSLSRVLCNLHCMMNKSLTPYLNCTRLRRVTAPQPPELISRAVASF